MIICRQHYLSNACLFSLLAILIFVFSRPVFADRPNVVLIIADDQSYRDFGFMGNRLVHTPHLNALAKSSARYPNGYVPMSVCRPSLATLLTGFYPHQHGIHFNHPPPGLRAMRKMSGEEYRRTRATTDKLINQVPTLPRILARHGYVCLQTGKHWEGNYRNAGFTDGMTLAKPTSRLSAVTGTRLQEGGDWVAHGNGDAGLTIGRETMKPIDEFVSRWAGKKPFMVWYAPFLPHTPFDAGQRFRELYENKKVPGNLLPYYAEIARFDETVGQLMSILTKNHALQNTLIVFVSDNGFRPDGEKNQRHNKRSKLSVFEDGIRTPVLFRLPAHTVPGDHLQLVSTVDIVPTILSAVGLEKETTSKMPGIDLWPSALGQKQLPDRSVFGTIYPNDAVRLQSPAAHVRGRWVRWKNYKLVVRGKGPQPLSPALFDLLEDPEESTNLINEKEQTARITKMKNMLDQWWKP